MKKLFNNILVPVDAAQACDPAIERAVHIANSFQCHVHLIFFERSGWLSSGPAASKSLPEASVRSKYCSGLQAGLQLRISTVQGNAEKMITEYAIRHSIDLVVLGRIKRSGYVGKGRMLNLNRLSRHTDCPVLTVRDSPGPEKIRNIVIPVSSHLPVRKIIMASYLAEAFRAKIHLVALSGNMKTDSGYAPYLYKSYQLLKDNTKLSIECHAIAGDNIADAALEYAKQINADLIVVNTGNELRLRGFINWLFPRFIFNNRLIPVMTIKPPLTK